MRFYRIGDKVVSREKIHDVVDEILGDREAGATQEEVARGHGVQRSFVSFLESLGEVRRGARVALIGFPVANTDEVMSLAEEVGVDFTLVFSQAERERIESASASEVFNRLLETLATLRDYDVVVLMASDWRIELVERILGAEVVSMPLGQTPLREDVEVDLGELRGVLEGVMSARVERPRSGRVSAALRDAAERAGRWGPSRRS
ncbi:MAG: transcriptional regulator [Coriobacteriia bacterium]|nr:transcriptional regulator [Coriobacteriia bacterium]